MANCNPPVKAAAFDLSASLFTTAGALITNPGTLTLKISKDFGDWADSHNSGATPTEEDSTYGQIKIALDTTDMNADVVDVYLIDNTSGCIPFKATIYTCSATRGLAGTALPAAAADAAGGLVISDAGAKDFDTMLANVAAILEDTGTTLDDLVDGLESELAKVPKSDSTVSWNATARSAIGLAVLDQALATSDADAEDARTVRSALRLLRNKVSITTGVMTVTKENDSTAAWTAAVTGDSAADPIVSVDPT